MTKEKTLHDEIQEQGDWGVTQVRSVKKFLAKLKGINFYKIIKDFQYCGMDGKANDGIKREIDSLAGEELVK